MDPFKPKLRSLADDVRAKWEHGKAKYGRADDEWAGLPPMEEAYLECLDLLNYLTRYRDEPGRRPADRRWCSTQLVRATILAEDLRYKLWAEDLSKAIDPDEIDDAL